MHASASLKKSFPLLWSSYEPLWWLYSATRDPPVMLLLRSCMITNTEGRRGFYFVSFFWPLLTLSPMCMRGDPDVGRCWERQEHGENGGTDGRSAGSGRLCTSRSSSCCTDLFIFFHQSFSLSASLSLSLTVSRSSAGAVTPVIPLSISSLTPSFLYLSLSALTPSQEGLHVSPDNNGVRI